MMVQLPLSLALLLTLSGCSTKEFKFGWYDPVLPSTIIVIKKIHPNIDHTKLKCLDIPKPQPMTKQSEVSAFLVDVIVAGKQCKSNLNYVRMILTNFKTDTNTTEGLQND